MAVVEITLTAEQLAAAYLQLSAPERRSFLETVFSHPAANHHLALELLMEAHAVLQQKFPPAKQRLLDQLLSKNTEGTLRSSEHTQLAALMAEYEAGLVEKARARYIVALSRHAAADEQ